MVIMFYIINQLKIIDIIIKIIIIKVSKYDNLLLDVYF